MSQAGVRKKYKQEAVTYFDKRVTQEGRQRHKKSVYSTDEFLGPQDEVAYHYAPPKKSFFYELFKRKRLRLKHLMALSYFINDAVAAQGNSHGLTAHLRERVDMPHALKDHTAYHASSANDQYNRVNALWNMLHGHEKLLFKETVLREVHDGQEKTGRKLQRSGGTPDIGAIGTYCSGYTSKDSAYAAGASRIQAILDTFAEFYQIKKILDLTRDRLE